MDDLTINFSFVRRNVLEHVQITILHRALGHCHIGKRVQGGLRRMVFDQVRRDTMQVSLGSSTQ
jgi:hypothetical protein